MVEYLNVPTRDTILEYLHQYCFVPLIMPDSTYHAAGNAFPFHV